MELQEPQQQDKNNEQEHRISVSSYEGDKKLEYIEPNTHKGQKGVCEKLLGNCLKMNYNLNQREIKNFIDLKMQCNRSFKSQKSSHNQLVCKLWYMWKGEKINENEINQEEWKILGFQQANPRTDFRGAGIMGLKQIINYLEKNKFFVTNQMLKESNEFIFAISSINITFFLQQHFQLHNYLDVKKDQDIICGRKAFKTFNQFLSEDPTFFFNLHEVVLTDLYKTWEDMRSRDKTITLLDFGRAQELNKRKLRRYFSSETYANFEQFKQKFCESL